MNIRWSMSAEEIEAESFRIIESQCTLHGILPEAEWKIARRLIHATGDMQIAENLRCLHNPVEAALQALQKKAALFCDSNMIRAGLSLARLRHVNPAYRETDILCYIDDLDVVKMAHAKHCTRSVCSVEKAGKNLRGAIILAGNAPLALARVAKLILEDDVQPAVVIAMPVGFVNVIEAKELLACCAVPQIVLQGHRGGSPLAVAALHAILENAEERINRG